MLHSSLLRWVGKSYHFTPAEGEIFFIQKQQFADIYIHLILSERRHKHRFFQYSFIFASSMQSRLLKRE